MTSVATVEDYQRLEEKISDLQVLLKLALGSLGVTQVVKVSDIAEIEGVSRNQLLGREAYLLPNFGESEYPDGVRRWKVETFLDWRKLPIAKRRAMYMSYLEQKRKKAQTQN